MRKNGPVEGGGGGVQEVAVMDTCFNLDAFERDMIWG